MISESIFEADNFWLEGFETNVIGMEVQVASGIFFEDGREPLVYPAFAFDIEADADFDVVYDVYLGDLPYANDEEVIIERTVMGYDSIAAYTGPMKIKFTLMSFTISKNILDLVTTDIVVRKVVRRIEEDASQQQIVNP